MFEYLFFTVLAILLTFWFFGKPKHQGPRSVPRPGALPKAGETLPMCNPKSFREGILCTPEPDVRTAYDVFEKACQRYSNENCLGVRPVLKIFKDEKVIDGTRKTFEYPQLGKYEWITYAQTHTRVHNFGAGLIQLGLKPKGFLAIYEETRMEWTLAMRGAFTQNMVVFTVYANLGLDALVFALGQGEITHIVCNGAQLKMIASIKKQVQSLSTVIYTDQPNTEGQRLCSTLGMNVVSFQDVEALGAKNPSPATPPSPDDLACIMYTSGSTGVPKGVMIVHKNIVGMVSGVTKHIAFERETVLHYLPLAHAMAFSVESVLFYKGTHFGYGNVRTLTPAGVRECDPDLKELSPTIFVAVPTIFERIMHAVNSQVSQKPPIQQKIFNLARQLSLFSQKSGFPGHLISDKILNPVRARLGIHKVKFMITGSAPLSAKIHDWVRGVFGSALLQGYGLTETNATGTVQMLDDFANEEIGSPLASTEWKLVDVPDMGYRSTDKPNPRGEIFLRGVVVSNGYFKAQDKTDESFFGGDGEFKWFATGDVGMMMPNGNLKIIDRKKNLIKASHGEYIAVEKLESVYKNCPWVSFLMVYADGAHFDCVLLAVPNKIMLTAWAKEKNIPDADNFTKLCNDKAARTHVLQQLQVAAKDNSLRSIEIVKNVFLVPDEWTPENEMLTAAMKLNRTFITKKNIKAIEQMYTEIETKN